MDRRLIGFVCGATRDWRSRLRRLPRLAMVNASDAFKGTASVTAEVFAVEGFARAIERFLQGDAT